MTWWDYKTGLPFQTMSDIPQPGSLDAEAGIFCSTFDITGTRLITGCADKTIKIYKEVSWFVRHSFGCNKTKNDTNQIQPAIQSVDSYT